MFRSSALSSSAVAGGVTAAAAATEGAVCSDVATSTKGCKAATSSDGSPPLQVRNWISQSNKNKFYTYLTRHQRHKPPGGHISAVTKSDT